MATRMDTINKRRTEKEFSLFECELLNKERDILKLSLLKTKHWPTNITDLIRK